MRIGAALVYLRDSFAEVGMRRTVVRIVRRVCRMVVPEKVTVHPFDVRHGVETSGFVSKVALTSGHENDRFITAYLGTAPSLFRDVMEHWSELLRDTALGVSDFAFVDIGSGKGRVLMMASELPFRQVLGVELSPDLVAIGQRNIQIWKRTSHACDDIALIHADAVAAPLPESHLLIYMFNPFQGPVVKLLLERLQRLAVEGSRFIDLGYARPEHADVFDGIANVRLLYAGEAVYTAEDTEADFFKTQVTDYRIYRIFADPRLAGEAKP